MSAGTPSIVLAFVSGIEPPVLWVIGGLVGLILEMLVPAFVIGSFGVSALAAGGAAALSASLEVQVALFVGLGFALAVPARRYLHRGRRRPRSRDAALWGRRGTCVEPIDGDLQAGVVEVDGVTWAAVTPRGGRIARGEAVEVIAVEEARLLVGSIHEAGAAKGRQ